ncbi:MAG: response regulator [Magnetococcales bacterium]|nr:response regulator [Magnetococcales bacterium]MBF0151142.1 response regulator [Magnetococcales bacterium]MBF0172544.1 response regulator [Magnetococcales bacterium]MBF0347070.1 response regulator [Magnetococcales bacterium]MBF0629997.1 response regulator [Magnetococcales bacterium]
MQDAQPVTILMVEDDDAHAALIERNLRRGGIINKVVRLDNGRQALDFLFNRGRYANHQRPAHLLMLLDLNMPEVDGYQVIREMKKDELCHVIPVVILTTTNDPQEVQLCYELGCNNFVAKPVEPISFAKTIQSMGMMINIMSYPCCS